VTTEPVGIDRIEHGDGVPVVDLDMVELRPKGLRRPVVLKLVVTEIRGRCEDVHRFLIGTAARVSERSAIRFKMRA
jgi:hypothetical protein